MAAEAKRLKLEDGAAADDAAGECAVLLRRLEGVLRSCSKGDGPPDGLLDDLEQLPTSQNGASDASFQAIMAAQRNLQVAPPAAAAATAAAASTIAAAVSVFCHLHLSRSCRERPPPTLLPTPAARRPPSSRCRPPWTG